MSMALVIAGLFIGSSVVYYARIEPVVFGIPVIGFMGYVSALVRWHLCWAEQNIWLNSHGGQSTLEFATVTAFLSIANNSFFTLGFARARPFCVIAY